MPSRWRIPTGYRRACLGDLKRSYGKKRQDGQIESLRFPTTQKAKLSTISAWLPTRSTLFLWGVDKRWFVPIAAEERARIRRNLTSAIGTLFVWGRCSPEKSLERRSGAYLRLPPAIKDDVGLLIVGRAGWQCEEIVGRLEQGAYGAGVTFHTSFRLSYRPKYIQLSQEYQ